ncbi:gas vesicle protein [Patescibacteria group bacterium]|nr:gas vesicle protein [Patescibacteria group bacterium]MBU3999851.1 gas vesicle protein [Patescibacteria group bacterium]MBU4056991.1 gas vesicle protein [Patescibacteria group bacterium]MBU4369091.1 gas vesicle protein [Patescibacteria group bacterium]
MSEQITHSIQSTNLADILERVLDKGIVIAGDIQIKLADVELLTIKIRLLIASVDKAKEMGINWWEYDSYLSSGAKDNPEYSGEKANSEFEKRIKFLEEKSKPKPKSKKRK